MVHHRTANTLRQAAAKSVERSLAEAAAHNAGGPTDTARRNLHLALEASPGHVGADVELAVLTSRTEGVLRAGPLMDHGLFARNVGDAFPGMWRRSVDASYPA